jgi:hypothetical protein
MDLFALLQTAFIIFASIATVTLIASFIAYKIKHYRLKDNGKNKVQSISGLTNPFTMTKGDIVHTVALPEAGTINIVPKPIMTKRRNTNVSSKTAAPRANASRFTVVNGSTEAFNLNSSFDPVNSLNRSKFNIN